MIASLKHLIFGCAGHLEHVKDAEGIWWLGMRCHHCGKLKSAFQSAYQSDAHHESYAAVLREQDTTK